MIKIKYFESNSDFCEVKLNTPLDIVRYLITVIFLAPVRLTLEISRKILFTGEYLNKFLVNCFLLNSIMILLSVLYSFFISKSINLSGGLIPLPSQFISLTVIIILYLFQNKYSLSIDFTLYSEKIALEKYDKVYFSGNSSPEEVDLEKSNVEDEIEIIDYDNVEEQIDILSKEIPGVLSDGTKEKLAKLTADLKKDMNFSSPNANVSTLYNNIKEKEGECIDVIKGNKFAEEESIFLGGDIIDRVQENVSKRDFSSLLGDLDSRESVEAAVAKDIESDIENANMQEEFYRAYSEMNPVDMTEEPELHLEYEKSFNMNIKANSDPSNPLFHKYSNKEWEVPIGSSDTDVDSSKAKDIMDAFNNISSSDLDEEVIDPFFDFNELLDEEEYA